MPNMKFSVRAVALASSAVSTLLPLGETAQAQDQNQSSVTLPQIEVRAPSPIVHRRPARPSREAAPAQRNTARTTPSPAPAPTPPALLGSLPIVSDQFATVTVVPKEEITRNAGTTLGDLLFSKPGITGSSFAPGASSRPIIRGLDVNRAGIVENALPGGGASDLGEDHFVPIDPLATSQIEVIRGPAALRYGSTSIGGVVAATNNRIPDAVPACPAAPFQAYGTAAKAPLANVGSTACTTFETRTAVSSVDRGIEGGI